MKPRRKCCAHCPGNTAPLTETRPHECSVPNYVSGNLRVSSLRKFTPGEEARAKALQGTPAKEIPVRRDSCCERFYVAKKFHAENLQHQPLPDRIDDAVFTNHKLAEDPFMRGPVHRCQRITPKTLAERRRSRKDNLHKYGPALGCKKPMTYMDLAICWETPIDASYEPRRPPRIDGSYGGSAPAIFALVQHDDATGDVKEGYITMKQEVVDDPECHSRESAEKEIRERRCQECECGEEKEDAKSTSKENDDLCKDFDAIHISDEDQRNNRHGRPNSGLLATRCKRLNHMRHCVACDHGHKNSTNSPRRPNCRPIKSASYLQKCTTRRNGLPSKPFVPRPRTPYARRSFCIDTLTPPFSIVNGCRDADYPEHWRLTSVYQQSYRNPRKMREGKTILTYDR